jgi:glycosyltransferase involved in cell wall biosynthesis
MTSPALSGPSLLSSTPDVDVVVPVFNEERALASSVTKLHAYLEDEFPLLASITIVDNASTDGTWVIAKRLQAELPGVRAVHLDRRGRGRALRAAWAESTAKVVAYMDVDLSTDLAALHPLVAPLISGHSDVAIGSRLARGSRVVRGPKREFISRAYNLMLRVVLGVRFSDAQCGFKAVRADRVTQLLPLVADDAWFFDTELLVLAERSGMRIHEVPVDWVEDPDSRVDIVPTAVDDLKGIARLGWSLGRVHLAGVADGGRRTRRGTASQLVRFGLVGAASTLFYVLLYTGLRSAAPAEVSNAVALAASAIGNTAANRRFTFGVRGRRRALTHQTQGLIVFGVALALTSSSLVVLKTVAPSAPRLQEILVLVAANAAATLLRFTLFRGWVFRETTPGKGA